MKKEHIPGWLLMAAVGVLAMLLSNLVVAGGKPPLEATALAVIIGLLARNIGAVPTFFHAGVKQFEKPLIWGVILIGEILNFKDIGSQGPRMLAVILVTMTVSYFVIYALGQLFLGQRTGRPDLAGRLLIVVSMAGIGLNTAFGAFREVGLKPLAAGFLGALVVAACSILMISALL